MSLTPRSLPAGFAAYSWTPTAQDVARRRGLDPTAVIRFDANVPPFPGVPRIPVGESFARLNEYPPGGYRELHAAAAAYVAADPAQIVLGAGSDSLIHMIARTYLGAGRRTAIVDLPTYSLYAIAAQIEGAEVVGCSLEDAPEAAAEAAVIWICNPHNPSGNVYSCEEIAALAGRRPEALVVIDEAYVEYGAETMVPFLDEAPNCVVLRTLSKAFGFAALRVGYAVCAPEVATELRKRSEPAPISAPSARIAAAALLDPRLDVEETVLERARVRDALLAAGFDCPQSAGNFLLLRVEDATALAEELESKGLVLRRYPNGLRFTVRLPAENDRLLEALGVAAAPSARRTGLVIRTTAETSVRASLALDGQGRARIDTGVGFLDHLLTLFAFHGRIDLEILAGGDLEVDEHHTVEDVLATLGEALAQALGARTGLSRYGSATVPMDEARGTAAIDLGSRPHAEVALAFTGERVGGLALSLLPHALERLAMQGRFTLHVEASGTDDHHVAEAAFKALGRALADACASAGTQAITSTKGEA
ncbi:MAG TPA: aminotransferase class I/II-fold pyridoxal phosphate-dependent enzyme [Gaiellaceae bacterium]